MSKHKCDDEINHQEKNTKKSKREHIFEIIIELKDLELKTKNEYIIQLEYTNTNKSERIFELEQINAEKDRKIKELEVNNTCAQNKMYIASTVIASFLESIE